MKYPADGAETRVRPKQEYPKENVANVIVSTKVTNVHKDFRFMSFWLCTSGGRTSSEKIL